jgi:uncharacterized membrane protein
MKQEHIKKYSSKTRHLLKSITWRLVASLDTFLLSYIISSNFVYGLKISVYEIISKFVLYYFHERCWYKSKFKNRNLRHSIKPFTWRIIGSIDTLIISSLIFNDVYLGFQLASFETLTKLILYYIHDKVWYKSKFGLQHEKKL